jgi:ubiquinone/menaquinone biosynthesis C-methylase UbiE
VPRWIYDISLVANRVEGMMKHKQNSHDNLIIDQFSKQAVPFASIPGHSAEEATKLLVEMANISKNDTVLDVACGPGLLVCALAPYASQVTGIDLVPKMIELAKKAQQEKKLTNVSWKIGNVLPLPYEDNSFFEVVSRYTFHHFLDPKAVLREMVRVASSHGRVAVIDVFTSSREQSDAYDRIEKLRDPSHTHTLTLTDLQGMAASVGLMKLAVKFYKVEIELEQQLKASFPKEKGDIDKIRQAAITDIGKNNLGWGLHRKGEDIYTSLPIAIIVGQKQ